MNASTQPKSRKIISILAKQLIIAPDNPRKTPPTKAADDELKGSIESIGVVMPLIVKEAKKNQFAVHAGGRRLKQTSALIREKKLGADYKLPCIVVGKDTSATEIAMIETTLRADMHLIDQYEAYAKMHEVDGLSVAEIALNSGRSEHAIRKVLALGGAHQQLRKLCREGVLSLEALQAYCITDDKKKQLEAFKALEKQGQWAVRHTGEIRKLLTSNSYTDRDKIVKCVTVDLYRARGGQVTTDLFQGQSILHDTDLVQKLFQEKLDAETQRLTAEGWKWVETDLEYSEYSDKCSKQKPTVNDTKDIAKQLKAIAAKRKPLEQEYKKLPDPYDDDLTAEQQQEAERRAEEIDELLEGIDAEERTLRESAHSYTDKQKAAGGCIVTVDENGQLRAIRGLIKPEDQKKPAAKKNGAGQSAAAPADPGYGAEAEAAHLSNSVKDDLRRWHLAAAKTELLYTPDIMFTLMQFSICWTVFTDEFSFDNEVSEEELFSNLGCPISISLKNTFAESTLGDIGHSRPNQEIAEYRKTLNLTWLKQNAAESWKAFHELPADDVKKLVAYCGTMALNSKLFGYARTVEEGPDVLDVVLQQINARLAKHWRPTAENYFSRVPRNILEAAGKIIDADPAFPKSQPGIKTKKQLVEYLGYRTSGDNRPTHNNCWLPEGFLYHTLGEEKMP